ncbi:MAG: hypothetical protein FJ405_18005, partial [Verrucomicrobia bacterium]|nr:hypothetical protein [Verrucomicrobiota bacterium]
MSASGPPTWVRSRPDIRRQTPKPGCLWMNFWSTQLFFLFMNKVPAVLFAITAGMILCQALALRAGDYGEKYESYPVDADYPHASPAALEAWRDQKFGLRIHWGVYAVLGLQESWPLTGHRVNGDLGKFQEQYNQLYQRFNPTEFNADQWCEFMRRCGFTFFVFTARHHDGFSMFDTRTKIKKRFICTGPRRRQIEDCDYHYSIMDTPFRRDVTKELAEAAHRRGLGVGLYYSHTDWHDADFRLDRWHPFRDPKYSPQTDPEGWQRFIARHREQVRELLTGYGKIERFEWDLCFPESAWLETVKTVKMARKLQPDVLMRDRGIGNYGDIMTPEMWIPKANPDDERAEGFGQVVNRPWQVIIHMGNQFSYDPKAENYKSFDWALTNLIDIVSKGGNFMVGIGPDGTGRFHPVAVQRLERVGRWLAVNGEAIYRTRPHRSWHDGESIR